MQIDLDLIMEKLALYSIQLFVVVACLFLVILLVWGCVMIMVEGVIT